MSFIIIFPFISSYRSGKLPKAFKIIPSLSNWEEVSNDYDFI